MPETVGGDQLGEATRNAPAAVVLIVHAADSRYWQCPPADREDCANSLVIDRVAWLNGSDTPFDAPDAHLTAPGEELVVAYQTASHVDE